MFYKLDAPWFLRVIFLHRMKFLYFYDNIWGRHWLGLVVRIVLEMKNIYFEIIFFLRICCCLYLSVLRSEETWQPLSDLFFYVTFSFYSSFVDFFLFLKILLYNVMFLSYCYFFSIFSLYFHLNLFERSSIRWREELCEEWIQKMRKHHKKKHFSGTVKSCNGTEKV